MNTPLSPARRDELVDYLASRLHAIGMTGPAILLLEMHAPLSFLGSQLLFAAQPFIGWLTGERLARDLAYLFEEPKNIERLISRLEE